MRAGLRGFCLLCLLCLGIQAQPSESHQKAVVDVATWATRGAWLQFTQFNSLYYAAAGLPLVWYSREHDQRLSGHYGRDELNGVVDAIGNSAPLLGFPLIPLGFYFYGRRQSESRHIQFAKEYAAAMYLTYFETMVLSHIDVHRRPDSGDLSFWETRFRGKSSWPSGHAVPYMTLFFKSLQFYAPAWSLIPLSLGIVASIQRVQDRKHWTSDLTSSLLLSAWASEGVRAAAGHRHNHPFYRWLFEHDVQVGLLRHGNTYGPRIAWNY